LDRFLIKTYKSERLFNRYYDVTPGLSKLLNRAFSWNLWMGGLGEISRNLSVRCTTHRVKLGEKRA
jgi:hypothetical protein